jgi:type I restriction-modification system DNA methylase subunit
MAVPDDVKRLIERFDQNLASYRSPNYNETQLRIEFLDPFFKALGWDINNEQGYAEAYKEVIHEDAIKVGGFTKAPDYCFRIGSERKFFLEAKKPAINIKEDVTPAYQLRRYAWSAKLPLSILSDFDEFATYDCRIRPLEGDKPSTARILYIPYRDYEERWEEIYSVFSKEAVLKGSFDRYAESAKRKKGTAEVDDAFLSDIESWRDVLARNLALRNPSLSQRELNYSVQVTIDRIIFLRICEDRGIENYGQLLALTNSLSVYPRLLELFQRADNRYNSGLFHFNREKNRYEAPDTLTPHLLIDDKVLKEIIKSLYYPNSPYEFSVLPADILGQVYEQFLGKVIRLTAGHQAKVEDKPEVKKAGGVYYTPTYIVEYIVEQTVGKLLEGKSPKQVAKMKILDPACGSGSFLISAYQKLLDWHRDWYIENNPVKHHKEIFQRRKGEWKLTVGERKRILLNNIYGVDIDPQAVEVTKLSLLLKVLEGPGQLELQFERALPDLSANVKCGNSLIGPDFYANRQMSIMDDEERWRVNAFYWEGEFPEIFGGNNYGFDAVIGNPPYIRGRSLPSEDKSYFVEAYNTFTPNSDIYVAFLERSFLLLRKGGLMSFIIPRSYLCESYAKTSRYNFLKNAYILNVVDFKGVKVFKNATVTNIILVIKNQISDRYEIQIDDWTTKKSIALSRDNPLYLDDFSIRAELAGDVLGIIDKAKTSSILLDKLCYISYSVAAHSEVEGKKKDAYIHEKRINNKCKRFIEANEIERYQINYHGRWLEYDPLIVRRPGLPELFEADKIVIRDVVGDRGLIGALDASGFFADYSVICLTTKCNLKDVRRRKINITREDADLSRRYSLFYVLGIINSKLMNFIFQKSIGAGLHVYPNNIRQLPIRIIDFSLSEDKKRHDNIAGLVNGTIELRKGLSEAVAAHDRELLRRQIETTDHQIDQLVYELYGLTPEEIKIVGE